MNATQAAGYLGVSERTVRRWIHEGRFPAPKRAGEFVIDPATLPLRVEGPLSEIDALRMLARIMDSLDQETRGRVLRWAVDRWKVIESGL